MEFDRMTCVDRCIPWLVPCKKVGDEFDKVSAVKVAKDYDTKNDPDGAKVGPRGG